MEINQGLYPGYLLASLLLGGFLCMCYDGFRILRLLRAGVLPGRIDTAVVFLEDLIFSLIGALCVSVLSYAANRGRIRWFSLAALLIGFVIYRKTLSRAVMAIARPCVKGLRMIGKSMLGVLLAVINNRKKKEEENEKDDSDDASDEAGARRVCFVQFNYDSSASDEAGDAE